MLTMSVSIKQSVLISLGILGVGSGVALLWIHRSKKRHLRLKRIQVELSKAIQAQNGVRKSKCHINLVQSIKDWEAIEKKFLKILGQHPIVGFDVEWVTPQGGSPRPVSLVQISFYTGWVILLRINKMESIPETLKDMLTDSEVIKMGVGIFDDAQKLKKDLGLPLRGALDLRHFVREHRPLIKKTGLAGLAMAFLGTEMDKDWRIRASDWETDPLSKRQLEYAANDALVATNIMLQIALESLEDSTQVANLWQLSKYSYVLAKKYYGVPFRLARNKSKTPGKESKNGTKSKPGPNPPKDPTAKMVTRKSKMYHNAKLEAPDGQPLCVCDTKKAQWYIEKGLGTLIQESDGTDECPMIVRLTFEPSGRPLGAAGDYYLSNKENVCVVCGQTESYVRKYIVPHEYRTHFPGKYTQIF